MNANATLTFLSVVSRSITSGERAGQLFYRAHFLNSDLEPTSFSISAELYSRLFNSASFGDVLDCTISIRSTPSGTYTQLVDFKN